MTVEVMKSEELFGVERKGERSFLEKEAGYEGGAGYEERVVQKPADLVADFFVVLDPLEHLSRFDERSLDLNNQFFAFDNNICGPLYGVEPFFEQDIRGFFSQKMLHVLVESCGRTAESFRWIGP